MVKNLPIMQETQVGSLGWEDALEEEMATHSSILAWRIPWTEEPGGLYSSWIHKELDRTAGLTFTLLAYKALARLTLSISSPSYAIILFLFPLEPHYLF